MKNARLIAALLAATFILSAIPVHAQEPKKGVVRRSITSAKKQFNESLDRFKRCMRGRCTRWEALKVARDLGIAAAAVIAAIYVGGAGLRRLGVYTERKGMEADKEGLIEIGEGMQRVGIGMQAPVTVSLRKLQLIAAQRRLPVGTEVTMPGDKGTSTVLELFWGETWDDEDELTVEMDDHRVYPYADVMKQLN